MKNTFLEKTIENWLTKTSELGYQMPFCQLLISEEFSICHISPHNAFEQGKDIIAIDKNGDPFGFQLKGGNISMSKWNGGIKAEIEKLLELTIVHPSVDKNKKHISYLVTNGYLEDTVRLEIDNLNAGKWKENPLNIWTLGELLSKFLKISGDFVPQDVEDYKSFLELYFGEGRDLIDTKKYSNFIKEVLKIEVEGESSEERKRNIASAVLFTSYIIAPYQKHENHISVMQILSLLLGHILALVEKNSLPDKYWLGSIEVVWQEIKNNGKELQNEIANDGLLKMIDSWWDGELGVFRKHMAVSYLLAYKVSQLLEGDDDWNTLKSEQINSLIPLALYGESGIFVFFLLYWYISKNDPLQDHTGLLTVPLQEITKYNSRDVQKELQDLSLMSPYYDVTAFINRKFNLLDEPIDETFVGRSFTIKSFIEMIARKGKRSELEKLWKKITHIQQECFVPEHLWQHFIWRVESGQNNSEFPNQTQSWKELVEISNKIDLDQLPSIIQKYYHFIPMLLLVYPHRITNNYAKFLDEKIL